MGDAAVPPGPGAGVDAVLARHARQGGREDLARPPGQSDGRSCPWGPGSAGEFLEIQMRRAIAGAAGDRPCSRRRRPAARTAARACPKTSQKKTPRQPRMTAASTTSPTSESWPAGIQRDRLDPRDGHRAEPGDQREHPQAAQEEEAEEGEMPVGDVARPRGRRPRRPRRGSASR